MNPSSVSLRHVQRLTDDTGIIEHALGLLPRRKEGYSTDDQARALWMCLEWLEITEDTESESLYRLIDTYLSFLLWVQKENGHFHNNIAYDRTREEESPSDDCLGRCLWALAVALVKLRDSERLLAARELFDKALTQAEAMTYPRGWAYALAALNLLVRHQYPLGRPELPDKLAAKLVQAYRTHSGPDWPWFEPVVSYSNGVLPWGPLCAYEATRKEEPLAVARESLDFIIRLSTNERGQIRPVGNRGWCVPGSRALWDQRPIDVLKLALAASKAYEITGISSYAEVLGQCRSWFYGENDAGIAMANTEEGSCYDGLGEAGANRNQGAESTLAYLLTEAIYWKYMRSKSGDIRSGNKTEVLRLT
ncbi:hypothetical protein LJK87_46500 [Paenibacillus sp. P25]|nr:hypothetical protein LJK87_46500 [Paenibacillus sp. P25]